ncbi:hypothetical protein [Brevibacillus borstelensis]|uniref:hypothetical protein n=1 Tax=Brevibacillus borstelensis TaxID=45462 RepID=UPI0030BABA37
MKHSYKILYANKAIAGLVMAALLAPIPAWHGATASAKESTATKANENAQVNQVSKQTMEKVYRYWPELGSMGTKVFLGGGSRPIYTIRFMKDGLVYADLKIDAETGAVLQLEKRSDTPEADASEAVAREKGEAFLRDMLGDEVSQYRFGNNSSFVRYVNDLPVAGDSYLIQVSDKGQIVQVEAKDAAGRKIDPGAFPKPTEAMDREQAESAFASYMKPLYVGRNQQQELVYRPAFSGSFDARTGKEVDDGSLGSGYTPVQVKAGGKRVTIKTPQEAAQVLEKEWGIKLNGATFEPSDMPKEMLAKNEKEYQTTDDSFRFSTINDQVVHFYLTKASLEEPPNGKISREEALSKAIQFLEPYLDPNVTELQVRDREETKSNPPRPYWEFSMYVSHEGIPVKSQRYMVRVGKSTGAILYFRKDFQDQKLTFPNGKQAISAKAAAEAYLKENPLELEYVYPVENDKISSTPVLVYRLQNRYASVDAFTGKISR